MKLSKKLGLLIAGLTFALATHAGTVRLTPDSVMKPTGKGFGELDKAASQKPNGTAGGASGNAGTTSVSYHGGPVMTNPITLYYIWYGTAWDTASKNLLVNMGQSIGGTPYWNIFTQYYDSHNVHVTNVVTVGGQTSVGYTHGTTLSDAGVQAVVSDAITAGSVPSDTNAIYLVLTDKTVGESSGFCTQYCGWHTFGTIGGKNIKYVFVGDAETQCPAACGATTPSVNSLPGADGMANILTHEMGNTATDPNLNGWFSGTGTEVADMCAWTWGTTSTASNGAKYNVTWGGTHYLVQEEWSISTNRCVLQ